MKTSVHCTALTMPKTLPIFRRKRGSVDERASAAFLRNIVAAPHSKRRVAKTAGT
jgi:hypothetical protein